LFVDCGYEQFVRIGGLVSGGSENLKLVA